MAITLVNYTGNGSTTLYSFSFPYLSTSDIKVKVNSVLKSTPTHYTFANPTTIEFVTAPANGAKIQIYRLTDIEESEVTFFPGSSIRAQDLNANFDQILYTLQEIAGRYLDKYNIDEDLDMKGYRIINLGAPIDANDASTKAYADTKLPLTGGTLTGNLLIDDTFDLRFGELDANGTNWVAFQAPNSIGSNVTFTLPGTDGDPKQVLKTNGSGTLAWQSVGALLEDVPGDTNSNLIYIDKPRDTVIFGAGTEYATAYRIIVEGTFSGEPGAIGIARGNDVPPSTGGIGSLDFLTARHETVASIEVQRGGGTWTPTAPGLLGSHPTAMLFSTTQDGLPSPAERMRITNEGNVCINTSTAVERLTVDGSIYTTGSLKFEGSTADAFETTLSVEDPTADRTITLPNASGTVLLSGAGSFSNADIASNAEIAVSKLADGLARQLLQTDALGTGVEWTSDVNIPGTLEVQGTSLFHNNVSVLGSLLRNGSDVVTVGDTGTVTSTMIANSTIVNADINASAGIVDTKLATISTAGKVSNSATTATSTNTASTIVARDASGNFSAGTITANLNGNASTVTTNANLTGDVTSVGNATSIAAGVIVNADVNASAAIAGTKISPDFGSQTIQTTGIVSHALGSASAPTVTFTGDVNSGIFSPAADEVAVATGGSERARIDSSGRLLVGTSSTSSTSTAVFQDNSAANGPAVVYLSTSSTTPSATAALGRIRFSANDHSNAAEVAAFRDSGTWTAGVSQPSALTFSTTADGASSPTERLRINNAGKLGFGTVISAGGVNTTGFLTAYSNTTSSTGGVGAEFYASQTGNRYQISFGNPNGVVGSISTNGTATAYTTSSDYRLKENVTQVTDGIARLQQLKPSRFNFIADPDKTVDGFIAHEVQAVVPEAITGEKDAVNDEGNPEYQGIDQSKLVPLLTAALQEAIAKIESLEARLTAAGI